MSTTTTTVTTGAPSTGVNVSGTITEILSILQAALAGLSLIPVVGAPAGIAEVFVTIIQKAMSAYSQAAGQPLDLTKIPLETPVS
jgi:hypothetical protein